MDKNALNFASLGDDFFSPIETQTLKNAFLIHKNQALYQKLEIGLDDKTLLKVASGTAKFQNSQPIASIYAGHQFGYFVPQLGDGRSCLIGQANGHELSLKGAGQTPFSRGADGRCVLRSSIREYLASIAMHGLGIPTTEALTLVGSQSEVYRENIEFGAIVMRTAPSHIRFGNFELFASRGQIVQVKKLADFVIRHYYPQCLGKNKYSDFLVLVIKRTAKMIATWQAQGFEHGVMNTDNMSILGLTIDYGPFGFLEKYDPKFICNHSDHEGRYAFDQQPGVALWNLSRLADALNSLISDQQIKAALAQYQGYLVRYYSNLMRTKFGLFTKDENDNQLIGDFLNILYKHKKDYTNSIRGLSNLQNLAADGHYKTWLKSYQSRIEQDKNINREALMNQVNPKFILRNYLAEVAIRKAQNDNDYREIGVLFDLLSKPFEQHLSMEKYTSEAPDWAQDLQVSCSS